MIVTDKDGKETVVDLKNGVENAVLQIFKSQAPYRSGTLKGQIRIVTDETGFEIISDIYYMPYTEEKWGYHKGWKKTLVNPNQGWFKEAFEMSLRFLASVYGKEFTRES